MLGTGQMKRGMNLIRIANETYSNAQSQLLHSRSQHQMGSEAAPTVDDSDVSTLSDEAEYSKAQWSFAAPTEEGEEEILSRNSKRPRVSSIGQDDIAGNTTRCPN
ncbi:hypothetical protein BDDG_12671 [Blastomyces dermatitidis ATCC 18188]|uniref:Uncharacterized protein n=1 Tax=Ajellomyces dermatitidis (strain ATCC 18188 / CBS 674.68) TaxID=653446 RepID=A0A0J9ESR7_AJEDA|nr:hypothetical protein BDDG_12671 [Blastomyces dermatitidis ATCC 18188]